MHAVVNRAKEQLLLQFVIIYDDFLEFMNNNVEKCFFGFPKATSERRGGQVCKISCQICYYLLLFMMTFWSELGNSVSVFQS